MKLRKQIKRWLYGSCPGFAGKFSYFGTNVYFPKDSLIFKLTCEQGIYELESLSLLLSLMKPNSTYFDLGANIGLMSIPVLHRFNSCQVVSLEPSPNTLNFLRRTAQNSQYGSRWKVVGKAAGNSPGELDFHIASNELGALDGFKDTNRAGLMEKITVPVTTLDNEWESLGKPTVSVIKIDIEGAELEALKGAFHCIKYERPFILTEWSSYNLHAYNCSFDDILDFSKQIHYVVHSLPNLIPIYESATLRLHMLRTQNFLLVPCESQ